MTALLVLATPEVEPVPSPPDPPEPGEPGHVAERVWEIRLGSVLVATLNRQGVRTRRRNGPGEAVVTVSMLTALEPAAAYLWGPNGRPITWRNSALELWVWRDGVLRHQGPIVAVEEDWKEKRATVRSWTREGHVTRKSAGMRGTTELLPRGHFDAGLSGWTSFGSTGRATSTSDVYRDPRVMILDGATGSFEQTVLTLSEASAGNTVRWTVPVKVTGTGWWPNDVPYEIHHYADGVLQEVYPAELSEADFRRAGGDYYRVDLATPQDAGVLLNQYVVRLMAGLSGSAEVRVGEVTAVRWDNISSRAGWDRATFASAVFQEVADDDPAHPWSRSVDPAGSVWEGSKRELKIEHGDYASFLKDLEPWGEWWVEIGSWGLRWSPQRGGFVDYELSSASVSGLRTVVDGTRAATRALVYADGDGQNGPTREEGLASTTGGAVLDAVLAAPKNTDLRDLEDVAAEHLTSPEGLAEQTVTGDPVKPYTVDGLPADLQYEIQPGCWLPLVESIDGSPAALDHVVRVESETCNDIDDTLSVEVTVIA